MSDTEGTAGSETEEVMEFRCRKCPDKTFTAAEKDAHRNYHRQEKDKNKKRPGPKSKTRSTRARETSPPVSELTLFQPVAAPQKPTGKRRRKDEEPAPASKRKSRKNYDDTVIGGWANGNGA